MKRREPKIKRAICKGNLVAKDLKIPVTIYLGIEPYRIHGHLFHEDCNGKIRQRRFCEIHEEDDSPSYFSAITVDENTLLPIDNTIKDDLLERKIKDFKIVGAYPISMMTTLVQDNDFAMLGYYEMVAQTFDDHILNPNEELFAGFISRLSIKKSMLLVQLPLAGLKRYCFLIPGQNCARIYPMLYGEEIRESAKLSNEVNPQMRKQMDAIIKRMERKTMPRFSCQPIMDRVNAFIMQAVTGAVSQPKIKAFVRSKEKVRS